MEAFKKELMQIDIIIKVTSLQDSPLPLVERDLLCSLHPAADPPAPPLLQPSPPSRDQENVQNSPTQIALRKEVIEPALQMLYMPPLSLALFPDLDSRQNVKKAHTDCPLKSSD
jgi:hypothetical protein